MKIAKIILLFLALLLTNCSGELEQEYGLMPPAPGQVTFLLGLQEDDTSAIQTRNGEPEQIARMWYAIANDRGEMLKPLYQKLEADFSKLTIEGLGYGDYTVVFLATTNPESKATINEPEQLSDIWLLNQVAKAPLDDVYFYKKIEVHIGKEQTAESQIVTLERCVGKVDIDLHVSSDYMWRFIRKIDITFDDTEGIYAGLSANGEYSGTESIESYDITENRSFYSLPSKKALSGFVTIESNRSDGTSFVHKYRFSNCKIEAGRISHISIDYRHPESLDGLLYIREEDFSRFRTDTMFLANEPRDIFYNSKHRSFYVNAPLQVSISDEHQLLVKFFSPIALSQLNRGVESREGEEGKRPQLSDLRESGAIEQDADMVCFIHRPEYYKIYTSQDGTDLRGMAEIIIAKHRNGAVGDVRLRFIGQYTRFQNPEDDMVIPHPAEGGGATFGSKMNAVSDGSVPPPTEFAPQTDNPFGGVGSDGPLPF